MTSNHLQNLKDRKLPAHERFWKNVDKMGPLHPTLGRCWDWTSYASQDGYGVIGAYNTYHKAHRFSWILHNGPVPEGLQVLHHCDRPKCVNPEHLYIGTQLDNIRDMSKRDRIPLGEDKWSAKLTEDNVREIRRRYKRHCRKNGISALAREFGVCKPVIEKILRRKNWRHVE